MAAKDGERRMLFDIRGRRKHVLRVVYAILALLMGGSLFLVVGPFNLAELIGGVQSGMGYLGAATLKEVKTQARFVRVTAAGMKEAAPHDVIEVSTRKDD